MLFMSFANQSTDQFVLPFCSKRLTFFFKLSKILKVDLDNENLLAIDVIIAEYLTSLFL